MCFKSSSAFCGQARVMAIRPDLMMTKGEADDDDDDDDVRQRVIPNASVIRSRWPL